jgi:hypothetical protein
MGLDHHNQRAGMTGARPAALRLPRVLLGALSLLLAVSCLSPAIAQAPANPPETFFPTPAFRIPFSVPPGARVYLAKLYVSRDQGKTWQYVSQVRPEAKEFTYTSNDGEGSYWFAVQTITPEGTAIPPDIRGNNDGQVIRVVVDSRPPTVEVTLMHGQDGTARVDWKTFDEYLAPETLNLEYRIPPGNQWYPVYGLRKEATGSHTWSAGTQPIEVRISVQDRAGNVGRGTSSGATPGGVPSTGGVAPSTSRPSFQPANPDVRYVNSKQIRVKFDVSEVGKSGVGSVEVWRKSIPGGWDKQPVQTVQVPNQKSLEPITITLDDKDGLYGYTLIAKSGVELGLPPPIGDDPPHFLIRVDRTPPSVKIHDVIVGTGVNAGRVTISWEARDTDNLMGKNCITISMAANPAGPWTPVHSGKLDNIGQYIWPVHPEAEPKLYFKVEAEDWAGNIGSAISSLTIIEQNKPRVQIQTIEIQK